MFGAVAIRRQGIYFAMITLALAQLVYFVALQAPFTGGEDGVQGVPRGRLFGLVDLSDDRVLYAMVAVIVLAGLGLIARIVHSPFGQVLRAHPRERGAGPLARLSDRALPPGGLRAVGGPDGPCGRDEGDRVPARPR